MKKIFVHLLILFPVFAFSQRVTTANSVMVKSEGLQVANNLSDVGTPATARANLGGTTLGSAIFTISNPSALGFIRANADNSVTHRSYTNVKTDLGLTIGTDVQAFDGDLTTWSGITPGSNVGTWIATPSSANLRSAVTDENGTGVLLFNGATTPDFTTGFTIGTAAATGKFIVGNGTNYIPSTSTIPTSAGATANKVLLSDGTNYVLSTPTFPNASATTRKIIVSDGTNWIASTELWPVGTGTGNTLISDGTNWVSQNTRENWTTFAVTGSNATTTGQALTDITGLTSGTLSNSTLYEVEAWLNVTTSAVTTGCQYAITGGGTGGAAVVQALLIGNSTGTTITTENIVASATGTAARLLTSGQSGMMYIHGWVTTRGSGTATISIQHLKVTSGTSTVLIGSKMKIRLAN